LRTRAATKPVTIQPKKKKKKIKDFRTQQFVRDWWPDPVGNKEPPGPPLPARKWVAGNARPATHEAYERLTGTRLRLPDLTGQVQ
jgi:hypothetical protein